MLGHREITVDEYMSMLRRRWWILLIPALVLPVITYGISRRIPDRYVSETLLLIEGQRLPGDLVKPIVTEELQQKLALMTEQILSRTKLDPLIDKFHVFQNEPISKEEKIERMRKQIQVKPIEHADSAGALPGFKISFSYDDPHVAQAVCSELTSMFVSENATQRGDAARGASDFIAKQVEEARSHLDELDSKLADFKKKFLGQQPGDEQQNMMMLMTTNSQLDAVTQTLNRAQQDQTLAESMLASQLDAWHSGQVTSIGGGGPSSALQAQLAAAQNQLMVDQGKGYTADHPDIIKLNNQITSLKQKIQDADAAQTKKESATTKAGSGSTGGSCSQAQVASAPVSIQQLCIQIHQIKQTIGEKTAEQARLQRAAGMYQGRVTLSPVVDEQFKGLTRDYNSALAFYNTLLSKEKDAEMAKAMELKQQGEQLRIMDPANLPEKPTYPDRQMFAVGGLVGGLALGGGIALLLEFRDKAVRTERDIEFWLELPTLAMLPSLTPSSKSFWSRFGRKSKAPKIDHRKAAEA